MILDFLVFVLYIQEVKNMSYNEAKIEASNICENVFFDTRYNNNPKVIEVCESVWRESFP